MKKITLLLLLSVITANITQAQTIGIIQGLSPVTIRQGPPFNGMPTVEFPILVPGPGDVYVNHFYKYDNTSKLVEIAGIPAVYDSSRHCNGDCYAGYCVNCAVNDFPQIYRFVTLNCPTGSIGSWSFDSTQSIETNPCTGSVAWSDPGTWYNYKAPTYYTLGLYIKRSVVADVNVKSQGMQVSNGSTITVNTGVTFIPGTITNYGGELLNHGIYKSTGNYISGRFTNNGFFEPGDNSIYYASFNHSTFISTSAGECKFEIASASSYDQLYAGDTAVLNGKLTVKFVNGFIPVIGNLFTILTAGYCTGTFATTSLPALPAGMQWKVTFNAVSVTLEIVTPPLISISDKSVNEGNSGTTAINFQVTLSKASSSQVKVNYATADSTAKAPGDYTATSGILKFNPGQISKLVTVQVNGDTQKEKNEKFKLILSQPVNATIADGLGIGTIKNDDASAFTIADTDENSGAAIANNINIKVSPNPAKNQILVSGVVAAASNYMELTDLYGRSLLKKTITGNIQTVDISSYPKGIYVVRYFDGSKMQQVKIVKE